MKSINKNAKYCSNIKKFIKIHTRELVCIVVALVTIIFLLALIKPLIIKQQYAENIINSIFSSIVASAIFALILEFIETIKIKDKLEKEVKNLITNLYLLIKIEKDTVKIINTIDENNYNLKIKIVISNIINTNYYSQKTLDTIIKIEEFDNIASNKLLELADKINQEVLDNMRFLTTVCSGITADFNHDLIPLNIGDYLEELKECLNKKTRLFYDF